MGNKMVVKWAKNYVVVDDGTSGDVTYYMEASQLDTQKAAEEAGLAQLALVSGPSVSYTADNLEYRGGLPQVGIDYGVGDGVLTDTGEGDLSLQRLVGTVFSEDGEGWARCVPTLNTRHEEQRTRITKTIKATQAGALGGRSASINSGSDFGIRGEDLGVMKLDTFSQTIESPGSATTGRTSPEHAVRLTRTVFKANSLPNGATYAVMVNFTVVSGTITVGPDVAYLVTPFNIPLAHTSILQIAYELGDGASGVTIQPYGARIP